MRHENESDIQSSFFCWLALHATGHPELQMFYAIPNGANKSIAARMKFKREGLKPGVPDVHLPLAVNGTRGLWIEFKSGKGRVSDVQWEWITKLRLCGHRVEVCRSWTQAANIVIDYLNLPLKKFDDGITIQEV